MLTETYKCKIHLTIVLLCFMYFLFQLFLLNFLYCFHFCFLSAQAFVYSCDTLKT